PDDSAATAITGALQRVPQLDKKEIEDVILGCAMPEAEQGMNVARIASLRAGLPVECSAMTINRFCASGLQAIAQAADRIAVGGADVIVACGVESMTMIPMGGNKVSANPWLVENYPDAYLSMGLTAERLAKRFGITREQADEFSLHSHQKALAAIREGKFDDETVPVPVSFSTPNGSKPKRIDPNGGAIALGHPLGCTGAKLTATIIRELKRRNGRYGIVTMCVGGGMGAAGIFENVG